MFQRLVLRDEGKAVPHKPGSEVHALPARLGLVAVGDLVVMVAGQDEARAREDGVLWKDNQQWLIEYCVCLELLSVFGNLAIALHLLVFH